MPSMVLLRHRDARISAITKRYHAFLSAHVPDLSMPSADDEASNPDAADDVYTSAADWLLTATRNKEEFRLVFEENMNYGFRRNLWALRPIAVVVDFALFIASRGSSCPAARRPSRCTTRRARCSSRAARW